MLVDKHLQLIGWVLGIGLFSSTAILMAEPADNVTAVLSSTATAVAGLETPGAEISAPLARIEQALAQVLETNTGLNAQVQRQQLALSLLQLGIIIRTHQPFERALAVVHALGQEIAALREPLAVLAPHAITGVATVAELRDSFGIILLPKLQVLQQNGLWDWTQRAQNWLSSLETSSPPVTAPDDNAQRLLAALERLGADDLAGAVAMVAQMDGASATLTAHWLAEAHARLAIDAADQALTEIVLRLMRTDSVTP